MKGWIKLHLQLTEKTIWKQSTSEHKTILLTLLLMANHEENEWDWGGKEFKVEAGQFVTSLQSIADECGKGISIKNVRSALDRFEKLGFLANKETKHGRVITIRKWELYQYAEKGGGKAGAPNEECKNDKNERKEREGANKFVPPTLSQVKDYFTQTAKDKNIHINIGNELERFMSFYGFKKTGW